MISPNLPIAIVGGGPGGLTLAKLLQLKGANVKVYERDLDQHARVQGAPLDLHDASGLAALEKAGLIEAFKNNFMPGADRMKIMNEQAEVLYTDHDRKPEQHFGADHFRPEIDRGALRKILLESLAPGTVAWNHSFVSMDKQTDGWLLHFKNAPSVFAALVVAADGAHSKLRSYLTDSRPVYSGITMLEGNIYDAKHTAPEISAMLEGGKIMAFGKGQNILMGQRGNGEIGFYASFKAAEDWALKSGLNFGDRRGLLAWFQTFYSAWSSRWTALFEQAVLPLIPRRIYSMPQGQYWEPSSSLTLLGDAAHVMPPFAGEGVNMAMLDALELSEYLFDARFDQVQAAISAYETTMRQRAAFMTKESLDNGERMHSDTALETMLAFFNGH